MSETAQSKPQAPQTRLLRNGNKAHEFTPEQRRLGAQRSAETRRERAKSHGQRVRELVEKKEKALVKALTDKALTGDVRALEMLWSYAYGTPAKVEPDEIDVNVSQESRSPVSLAELNALAARLGVDTGDGSSGASNPG